MPLQTTNRTFNLYFAYLDTCQVQKSGQNYAEKTNHRPRTPESPYQRKKINQIRFTTGGGEGKWDLNFFYDFPVSYQRRKTRFGGERLLSGPVFFYGGPQLSWQNQQPHGKNKLTSRQNRKPHSKTENLTAKPKTSRRNQIP